NVRLISMNNTLFAQLPAFDQNSQKPAHRDKDELARLDFNVCTLYKKLGQLDIPLTTLTKTHEKEAAQQATLNCQTSHKDQAMKQALITIQKAQTLSEAKVIESFQDLIHLMKKEMVSTDYSEASNELPMS